MDLQNILQKKYKRKNFFVTLAVTATGYMVMRSTLYKVFAKKNKKVVPGSGKIKVRINSSAVSRGKMPADKIKIGDTNV
jgi:hypothetical protein